MLTRIPRWLPRVAFHSLAVVWTHAADVAPTVPDNASAAAATTPAPTPAPTFWEQSTLTGNWGGLRDQMGHVGVAPFASWTGEIWGEVSGGRRQGMTQNMLLSWGFETDLQKVAGWDGAAIRVSFNWVQGQSPNNNTGAYNSPSYIDAANQVRVYNLYLRQSLLADQLKLKAGFLGADDDFIQSDADGIFLNTAFTAAPIFYGQFLSNGDLSVPQYAVDGPGLFARYQPKDLPVYFMAGVYTSDPGPDVSNNHGFEWRGSNSAVVIGEVGWNYSLLGRAGILKGGVFYNDGQFTNWDTGQAERGIYGGYALVTQTLCQAAGKDGGDPVALLSAFAYAGWAGPDRRSIPTFNSALGLNLKCAFLNRPDDALGAAVIYTGFSSNYTRSILNPNGPGVSTASETDVEFTYQAVLTPWFTIQPDVQVIFNPANSISRDTALVVGTRAVVTF